MFGLKVQGLVGLVHHTISMHCGSFHEELSFRFLGGRDGYILRTLWVRVEVEANVRVRVGISTLVLGCPRFLRSCC